MNVDRTRRLLVVSLALGSWLTLAQPLTAAAQNLRGLPMGAETASLGQAGVAGPADDGSTYLNPAALAVLDSDRLSLSTTVVSRSFYDVELQGYLPGWTERDRSLSLSDAVVAPTSLSYARAWGKQIRVVGALSLVVPVFESLVLEKHNRFDSPDNDSFTLDGFDRRNTFKRLLFGPSVALGIERLRLRFGASLFFAVTEMSWHSLLSWSLTSPTSGVTAMRHKEVHEFRRSLATTGVLGLQWAPIERLTLGLSVKSNLAALQGSGTTRVVERELLADNNGTIISEGEISDAFLPDPFELRLGLAYRLGTRVELRADVLYTLSGGDPVIGRYRMTYSRFRVGVAPSADSQSWEQTMVTRNVVNVSLGAALHLSPRWSLNLGFLTDRSSTGDREAVEGWLERARWPRQDRYLGTVGGSFRSGHFTLHLGAAAGANVYQSHDYLTNGSETDKVAPVLRFFFAGGMSTEEIWRSLF